MTKGSMKYNEEAKLLHALTKHYSSSLPVITLFRHVFKCNEV